MADTQRTLAIVKPDAVSRGATGEILGRLEAAGLKILALKKIRIGEEQARGFYAVHSERPFFGDLVKFMTSGPVVLAVLEGDNAIERYRDLLGPTDSAQARRERSGATSVATSSATRPTAPTRRRPPASRSPTSSMRRRSWPPSKPCRPEPGGCGGGP